MKHITKHPTCRECDHSAVNATIGKRSSFLFHVLSISFIVLLFLSSTISRAQILSTNDFDFSGALTANGWTAHSGAGTNPVSTTTGLTYTGFPGSGIGNAALVNNLGGEDVNITFANQNTDGQSIYFSFLASVTDPAATKTGDYFFNIGTPGGAVFTTFAARVYARITATGVNFGINNASSAVYGATDFLKNTTYLFIIKYTISVAGNDPVSLWVIPSGIPATEVAAGTAEYTTSASAGQNAINTIALRQGSSSTSVQTVVDGIRVGTTWESVTVPPVLPTQLAITAISPASPVVNTGFSVTVQSQDAGSVPTNVTSNTTVNLTVNTGTGSLAGGTLSGVIPSGSNTVTITGVKYDVAEAGVVLNAADGAAALTSGNSAPFTVSAPPASVVTLTGTLSAFSAAVGSPSTSQSYTVEGANLTDNILITPPTDFEIRKGVDPFSNSAITLNHTLGTVSPTTIDVRFNPAAPGAASGNITHVSSGAVQQDLPVSGFALAQEPTTQATATFTLMGVNSAALSFPGGDGASRLVVMREASAVAYAPTDGAAPTGTISSVFTTATDQGGGDKIVFNGAGTTVTVTGLTASTVYHVAVYQYNGTGTTANYLTPTTAIANASTLALLSLPIPVPMASQSLLTYTENFNDIANWVNNFDNGVGAQHWGSVGVNAAGTFGDGIRISVSTATFATSSTSGGVQRGSLTGNPAGTIVQLSTGTPNSNAIELHLDYTGVNAGTLSFDWSVVANSTGDRSASLRVFTSIDGINYTELVGAEVLDKLNNVPASGQVLSLQLPASFSNASHARIRFYEYTGSAGSSGSRAKIALDNIVVTAALPPTQLAITNINPASPVQNAAFSVTVQSQDNTNTPQNVAANTDVTLSLNTGTGLVGGTVTGTILAGTNTVVISGVTYNTIEGGVSLTATRTSGDNLTAGNSATFSVVAPSPTLTVVGTLNPFQTAVGTQSASQSYTVEGLYLTSDITITPPANFEVRTGVNAFSSSPITILQSPPGTVSTTTVDVRYAPAGAGPHSGDVTNAASGATTLNVPVSGTTVATEPTIESTVTIGCATTTSIVVNFTGGDGSNRIVVVKEAVDVSFTPSDGTAPSGTIDSDFSLASDQGGGNKIVYDGNGNTVTVSGLTPSTQYYFVVYEYNGNGTITDYLTSAFGSNNAYTDGPANYAVTNGTYTQDFDGLPSTGTFSFTGTGAFNLSACPVSASNANGWQFAKYGPAPPTGNANFIVDNGNSTAGSVYSYGTTASSDRGLGVLVSSTLQPSIGLVLTNTTSDVLRTVTISFTGEQWRSGASGNPTTLHFSYSLNGTSISTGTYTAVTALDFSTPPANLGITTAGPLDGNLPANQTAVGPFTFSLNGNWAPGQTLVLHWEATRGSGSGDGLAIDDFNFSATTPTTPIAQDHDISFPVVSTTSLQVDWVNEDATNRIVKINTSNSFTDPVDFNGYSANPVYGGGEQVVYNGPGTSETVTNLAPGTTYWFRVYGYNGADASAKYITSTAVLNPNSQMTTPVSAATKLAILSVNGGANPTVNQPFSVVVESQDNLGNPQVVVANTLVTLSVASGIGGIAGGTFTGTILANTSQVTITGVQYDTPDNGVVLQADGGGLNPGQSAPFDVIDIATLLNIGVQPSAGIVNTVVSNLTVKAVRADLTTDPNYTGAITVAINSGPGGGIMSGTLIQNAIMGVATFNDLSFSMAGTYTVIATASGLGSTTTTDIIITDVPTMSELVVPKFMGSKTAGSSNSTRTPIAVCLKIDNLVPNTAYDIRGGLGLVSDAATSYGAGNILNGSTWGTSNVQNAFTTDGSGSSGPFWLFFQPTGNSSRFGGGQVHNLRIGFTVHGGSTPTAPNFVGTKQITALDIQSTATVSTADDGAYLTGIASQCVSGKFILVYDNTAGTGDPIFVYQARQATAIDAVTANYSSLPAPIKDTYMQNGTSVIGQWPAVIPIGANNPNGVKRIEARNADNTFYGAETDADGVWPGGANTTTNARLSVTTLLTSDAPFSTYIETVAPASGCPGSSVIITGKYFTGATDVSFNGTVATFAVDNDGQITATVPAGATTGAITVTNASGCTVSSSTFTVVPCGITFTSNIFIQGLYSGGGLMQVAGAGALFITNVSTDPTDADTVYISVMEAASPYNEVETQKGILKTDGSVTVSFTGAVVAGNSYWIKLTNRNCVETWSAAPVLFSSTTSYPFSTAAAQAFSGNQADLGDGNFAIYSGDINHDGSVDGSDFLELDPPIQNGDGGYVPGDLNGDGSVDGSDFLVLDPNIQNGIGAAVPAP